MTKIRFIDLFSGIGGFRLGLERNEGFECVWSCDIDRMANLTYLRRFKPKQGTHFSDDIRQVNEKEIPNHDLLTGGFPCQTFSYAGKRRGFEDTRGTLFFEIARIVKEKTPTLLLLENVRGLLSHDEGRTFATILLCLDELGYDAEWQVLNSGYWVPQQRNRVFIIGHSRKRPTPKIFPILEASQGSINLDEKAPHISTLTASYSADSYGAGRPYIIFGENASEGQSPMRALTPLECERLQGFPDGWTKGIGEGDRYKCLGNAVTVTVIEFLGLHIYKAFKEGGRRVETRRV